jgi:hypothetical protein
MCQPPRIRQLPVENAGEPRAGGIVASAPVAGSNPVAPNRNPRATDAEATAPQLDRKDRQSHRALAALVFDCRASASATLRLTARKLSGLTEIESIPQSTRNSANSGWSLGA